LDNFPPKQETLKQHIRLALYQKYCWNKALFPLQMLHNPANWERKKESTCGEPLWTTLSSKKMCTRWF